MALDDLENKIAAFQSLDFKDELIAVIEDNEDLLINLQQALLASGLDAEGQAVNATIYPSYSPYTIKQKKKYGVDLGAVTDRVTNYMTGTMYDSMSKKLNGETIVTESSVGYFAERKQWSGEEAFDLNEDFRREFAEEKVIPHIQNVISNVFSK